MKKLELNKLETIQAGGFWDGVCLSVGAFGLAGAVGLTMVTGGLGGAVLLGAEAACLVREGYKLFS